MWINRITKINGGTLIKREIPSLFNRAQTLHISEFYLYLQDFHRLTDELTQQKEELQKQISLQAAEMESLTQEIQELRSELDRVSRALDVEREKQNFQSNLQDVNENQR